MPPRKSSPGPESSYDSLEHQPCYIFTPATATSTPSAKKRRISKGAPPKPTSTAPAPSSEPKYRFPTLLHRREPESAIQLRKETFQKLWSQQEARTQRILDTFNQRVLDDVSNFATTCEPGVSHSGKIPTALVLAGPNIASHAPLFAQFAERLSKKEQVGPTVVLTSKDAPNIKAALKKIIRDATFGGENAEEVAWDDEEEELIMGKRGQKLLNYDLQILQNWCSVHPGKKVIIAIQDTEAFDTSVMSSLVSLFSSYLDRIPFVLLLGIATSLEIFHDKLPKATIRLMQGEKFDVERAEECLAQVFNQAVAGKDSVLRLSAPVCEFLLERQRDHTQSIQTFVAALKYAYMAHFYANPLSVIMACWDELEGTEKLKKVLTKDHLQAIRHLRSFRRLVENKLAEKDTQTVRGLLGNDEVLFQAVTEAIHACRQYGVSLSSTLAVFEACRNSTLSTTKITRPDLYPRVISGSLTSSSPAVRELLLSVRKMNSDSLLKLLSRVNAIPDLHEELHTLLQELESQIQALADETTSALTSEFDIATSTLRGTAVSKKIELSAAKSGLTKNDSAYSQLVQQVHDHLAAYFKSTLKGTEDLFLHEIFFFEDVSLHKDVFSPAPRDTVEQALCKPSDFLGCECCEPNMGEDDSEEAILKSTNPPTSILYQLYLESGALINAYDLWTAFYSVIAGVDADDEDTKGKVDKATAQALFYRSVAELKTLGFVKGTRKRVDHLQKLAWKGL